MKKKFQIICFVLALSVVAAVTVFAAGGYDSANDPLVSLSYITDVFKPQIDTQINALKTEINTLKNEINALKGNPTTPPTNSAPTVPADEYGYEVIFLEEGDRLFADAALDVVLRSGSAKVISPFNEEGSKQGINDYTTGDELLHGDAVSLNHFLLIPRGNDGRGIEITSSYGSYVIVRGDYEIVKAAE